MIRAISLFIIQYAFFFLMLPLHSLRAQERIWPVWYSIRSQRGAPVKEGYIVLKNSDTVKGFIKLLPDALFYPVLDTGDNQIRNIDIKDISVMRAYHHSPGGPYEEYVNLDYKHKLWRLIGKKDNAAMYDDLIDLRIITLLVIPGEKIKLPKNGKEDRMLIRFIYKRYKIVVKEDDFRETSDIVNYILAKENERLKS